MRIAPPALALVLAATACGDRSSPGDAASLAQAAAVKPGRISVVLSPASASVAAGGTVAFSASVRGTGDKRVAWSIREPSGCGAITAAGVYAAPSQATTCHVVATSAADPAARAEAAVAVGAIPAPSTPAPVVTIAPSSGSVDACRTLAFAATVSGTAAGTVTWSVLEGSAGGSIGPDGVYTAPAAAGTYHVVATSEEAPSSSATVPVAVADRVLAVTLAPEAATVGTGGTAKFTATVTTTCGTFASTPAATAN